MASIPQDTKNEFMSDVRWQRLQTVRNRVKVWSDLGTLVGGLVEKPHPCHKNWDT